MTSIAGPGLILSQSIGSLVLGQSKFSTMTRFGEPYARMNRPSTLGDMQYQQALRPSAGNAIKVSDLAKYGAIAGGIYAVGSSIASYVGSILSAQGRYQTELMPRPELGGLSYVEYEAQQKAKYSAQGGYVSSIEPREELGGLSLQEYSSLLMGRGYLTGTGEQYLINAQNMADIQSEINKENAQLWLDYQSEKQNIITSANDKTGQKTTGLPRGVRIY